MMFLRSWKLKHGRAIFSTFEKRRWEKDEWILLPFEFSGEREWRLTGCGCGRWSVNKINNFDIYGDKFHCNCSFGIYSLENEWLFIEIEKNGEKWQVPTIHPKIPSQFPFIDDFVLVSITTFQNQHKTVAAITKTFLDGFRFDSNSNKLTCGLKNACVRCFNFYPRVINRSTFTFGGILRLAS